MTEFEGLDELVAAAVGRHLGYSGITLTQDRIDAFRAATGGPGDDHAGVPCYLTLSLSNSLSRWLA